MKVMAQKKSKERLVERFREAARMLGCDDYKGAFEANSRKVASVDKPKKLAKTGKRLLRPGPDKVD